MKMKHLLIIAITLFTLNGCKKQDVDQDLGNGFSINGKIGKGIYQIKKDGIRIASIDLNKESLSYSAYKTNATMAGHLVTPLDDSSGIGCMALIVIPDGHGGWECHQVVEQRLVEGAPRNTDTIKGAAVYIQEKCQPGEIEAPTIPVLAPE